MTPTELIAKTWDEYGCKIRPLRKRLLVRTETRPFKTFHGIWLPPSTTGTFDKDKSKLDVELYGRVLAVGSEVTALKAGDRIFFSRLYFAWIKKMVPLSPGEDANFIGFLFEDNVIGHADEDAVKEEVQEYSGASASTDLSAASLR